MRMNGLLSAAAALLLGCGGDSGQPKKADAKPAGTTETVKKTTPTPEKASEHAKPAPLDVAEPPPPKAVTDKDKKPGSTDEPKSPPPVGKSGS